jgi:hypothetical protein
MFCLLLTAVSVQAATKPVPEMRLSFPLNKDSRTWTVACSLTNGPVGSVYVITHEWVTKGESIEAWKEMFDEKTILTKDSVRKQVDVWKGLIARVDPKAEVKEEKAADGTITITYTSIAANEMGVSRYLKADDGIYILSYRVHPKSKNEATLKVWREIISSATLVSTQDPLAPRPQR